MLDAMWDWAWGQDVQREAAETPGGPCALVGCHVVIISDSSPRYFIRDL